MALTEIETVTPWFCEVGNLKTIADPEAYIKLFCMISGLQTSEHKGEWKQNPDAEIVDMLLVIQPREHFVNKQNEPTGTILSARNSQLRNKTPVKDNISASDYN